MTTVAYILIYVSIILFVFSIISSLIYLFPLVCLTRFHTINNAFTGNLAFAICVCGCYWLINVILTNYVSKLFQSNVSQIIMEFFATFCTLQTPLAFIALSVNRVCSVIYPAKVYFKSRQWAILCIGLQWTLGIVVTLPQTYLMKSVEIIFLSKIFIQNSNIF